MSDESRKPDIPDEESTIFSHHVSRDAIRREQKAERRRQQKALARELTATSRETRTVTIVMTVVLVVIVVICGLSLLFGNRGGNREMAPQSGHFLSDEQPELSQEGIKAALKEVYYTIDGGLMVTLSLSNGLPSPQTVDAFSITLSTEEDQEIAFGHQTDDWDPQSLLVPANGYTEFTVYMPKEDVKIADDPLEYLMLLADITATPEDSSVLDTTTAPTSTGSTTAK